MAHKFQINCLDLATDMAKENIEKQVQERYDLVYGKNVIDFNYDLPAPDVAKMEWKRNHSPYALSASDFISDFDMDLILFYGLDTFRPFPFGKPILAPIIPMHHNYYAPIISFCNLYSKILSTYGEKGKVKLSITNQDITMIIKFN